MTLEDALVAGVFVCLGIIIAMWAVAGVLVVAHRGDFARVVFYSAAGVALVAWGIDLSAWMNR
jgi:hypothetical protein